MKALIFSLIIISSSLCTINNAGAQHAIQQQEPKGKVQSSYVCYVNNTYMGKDQIPVEVDGKTYYGCCQGCVGRLKSDRSIRYSTDPLTGKEVDKATAYIVIKGNANKEVLYFQNKENYDEYNKNGDL